MEQKNKKVAIIIAIGIIILAVAGYLFYRNEFKLTAQNKILTKNEAKTKVIDFVNNNMLQPGEKAEVKNISDENGLYKITIKVNNQLANTYLSKDGKEFFPRGSINIAEVEKMKKQAAKSAPAKQAPKSDKPTVDLFVMSYCPYGTQIEKGLLPVLKDLGSKIDFNLKFVDYSMHGKKELDENLRQYCVKKDFPIQLETYLGCFLKKGEGTEANCLKEAKIDGSKITNCMKKADSQFKVTTNYNNKDTWSNGQFPTFNIDKSDNEKYKVKGSPTLVINGTQIGVKPTNRSSEGLLKTICSAFTKAPAECNKKLSTTVPNPGFGYGSQAANKGGGESCSN